jgi:hypothetical protein
MRRPGLGGTPEAAAPPAQQHVGMNPFTAEAKQKSNSYIEKAR